MAIQIYEQTDFTGGLNLRSDQFQLADNESPEMMNVEVDPRGGVFSRGGMRRINPADYDGVWDPEKLWSFNSATGNIVVLSNANNLLYFNSSNAWVPVNKPDGTPIVSDGPHGICVAVWGQLLYITTGANATVGGYVWTGSGNATNLTRSGYSPNNWQTRATAAANKMPQAEHIAVHANKMFAANTTEAGVYHPNRLRWSDEELPTNWVETDYIDIFSGGPKITGMAVVNGLLVIFKSHATFVLYGYSSVVGDDDFRLIQISSDVGCDDHHSMVATETGVYFWSARKGLFYFDGSNLANLFEPLRPAFDLGYINSSDTESVSVSWVGRRVWISLPYSVDQQPTSPTVNVIYDPSMDSYTMFSTADNKGVVGGCDFRSNSGEEWRLMVHPTVPCVLRVDLYNLDYDLILADETRSGFETVYRTKWFDAGSYLQRKMFRRPDLVMRETDTRQEITVDIYHDYQEASGTEKRNFTIELAPTQTGMLWDDSWAIETVGSVPTGSVWSADTLGGSIKTAKNLGLCKTVQMRFSGQLSKPWGINSIGYKWVPRRVKG